jgi:hypothetical protein
MSKSNGRTASQTVIGAPLCWQGPLGAERAGATDWPGVAAHFQGCILVVLL